MTAAIAVPDLIELATKQTSTKVAELVQYYHTFVPRSRAEKRKIQALTVSDGKTLDIRTLFDLNAAWSGWWPVVGIAHHKTSVVKFRTDDRGLSTFRSGGMATHVHFRKGVMRGYSYSGDAQVPLVPKDLMPWNPLTRNRMYVLFDVAAWENQEVVPVDPYLLHRQDAHRFRIVGHWDLTEKEKELMALLRA